MSIIIWECNTLPIKSINPDDYEKATVRWALVKGRAAIFADTRECQHGIRTE